MSNVPDGSNLGLGCGSPVSSSFIKTADVVLDLGSGAGFDCFIASSLVGDKGKVIGVDLTPAMVEKANSNAGKGGYKNVEFRVGDIEELPVDDNSIDVIISNCVINLVPGKAKAFSEAFRVLKPGGRMIVSDIAVNRELPSFIKASADAYVACLSGAVKGEVYYNLMEKAGFKNIAVERIAAYPIDLLLNDPIAQKIVAEYKPTREEVLDFASSLYSITFFAEKI